VRTNFTASARRQPLPGVGPVLPLIGVDGVEVVPPLLGVGLPFDTGASAAAFDGAAGSAIVKAVADRATTAARRPCPMW
jgi:hypothetical protein